jgi:peptidoglycan hydrolase CwlO-like protein
LSHTEPHDEFLQLCAVSTSGQLTEEEHQRLQEHLAVCPSCREALKQYESVVNDVIPAIAADDLPGIDPGPSWSQAKAEKSLFDRLRREERPQRGDAAEGKNGLPVPRRILPFAPESTWRHVWMLYAAGILLFVTLCFSAYWVGIRHGADMAKNNATPSATNMQNQALLENHASLEEQLSDASHEREIARSQIAQRDKALADLHKRLEGQAAEISRLKEAQARLASQLHTGDSAASKDLAGQRTELAQQLETAQSESQTLQRKLDSLAGQSAQDTAHAKTLESKVNDLTRELQESESALDQRDQLLSHDRDIRELMGARDLYIAEVYDVGDNGATKKPYGRVFYTRGKSLIFYAYDLDQQPELKRASTFQAWGRRGPDRQQALNLGIFYIDNASKKRWVLKFDDPKMLAQIDAVFVTVEPNGGSHKPSGKPLLFAYLKVDPNHP